MGLTLITNTTQNTNPLFTEYVKETSDNATKSVNNGDIIDTNDTDTIEKRRKQIAYLFKKLHLPSPFIKDKDMAEDVQYLSVILAGSYDTNKSKRVDTIFKSLYGTPGEPLTVKLSLAEEQNITYSWEESLYIPDTTNDDGDSTPEYYEYLPVFKRSVHFGDYLFYEHYETASNDIDQNILSSYASDNDDEFKGNENCYLIPLDLINGLPVRDALDTLDNSYQYLMYASKTQHYHWYENPLLIVFVVAVEAICCPEFIGTTIVAYTTGKAIQILLNPMLEDMGLTDTEIAIVDIILNIIITISLSPGPSTTTAGTQAGTDLMNFNYYDIVNGQCINTQSALVFEIGSDSTSAMTTALESSIYTNAEATLIADMPLVNTDNVLSLIEVTPITSVEATYGFLDKAVDYFTNVTIQKSITWASYAFKIYSTYYFEQEKKQIQKAEKENEAYQQQIDNLQKQLEYNNYVRFYFKPFQQYDEIYKYRNPLDYIDQTYDFPNLYDQYQSPF